jgi:hypothetical protein
MLSSFCQKFQMVQIGIMRSPEKAETWKKHYINEHDEVGEIFEFPSAV